MKLKYIPRLGDSFINETGNGTGNSSMVIHVSSTTIYTAVFKLGEKIDWENCVIKYDLELPNYVKVLNDLYDRDDRLRVYGLDTGSTVKYGSKEYKLASLNKVNLIGDKFITRPLLIDVDSASNYISENKPSLSNCIWLKPFITFVYESEQKSSMRLVKEPSPRNKLVTPYTLAKLNVDSPEEVYQASLRLFDTDALASIKNENLREKLMQLTAKTIQIGMQNDSIGIAEKTLEGEMVDSFINNKGDTVDFQPFEINSVKYNQVITSSGEIGWANHETDEVYTEPYFIDKVLNGNTYNTEDVPYVPIEDIDMNKTRKMKMTDIVKDDVEENINFDEMIDEGLDELDFEDLIDEGLDELDELI